MNPDNSEIHNSVVAKIKQVKVSPKFVAILDAMLDIEPRRTTPALSKLIVSGGSFLGMKIGDIGYNDFLGSVEDLVRNCRGVANAAGLTREEMRYFMSKVPTTEDQDSIYDIDQEQNPAELMELASFVGNPAEEDDVIRDTFYLPED